MFEIKSETVFTTFYNLRISEDDAIAALDAPDKLLAALHEALIDSGVSVARPKKVGAPGKGKARATGPALTGWTCPICGKQLKAQGLHMMRHPDYPQRDVADLVLATTHALDALS